jgi:cytochrome c oxidase subunit 4
MGGFAAAAAFFGAVDGYLIGQVGGAIAGAIIGAFVGIGLVLLAWKTRAQDGAHEPAHGHHSNYMLIWGVLFVLTMVEVSVAFLAFSKIMIVALLVILAVWKALLVALYYMHLRFEPRRLWFLAASPLPLAVILIATVLMEGW